jgi:UDP:flavonoid glycosyltransferase YjiC (YdhE family)
MDQPQGLVKPRILVAPLDWGLGHGTRCIPLIRNLLARGCEVFMAGEGSVGTLLQQEFPNLPLLPLEGYRITYSRSKWSLPLTITAQIPRIISAIEAEHDWLIDTVEKHRINAAISDNRYGLHHPVVPTIFLTHQLLIKTPLGSLGDTALQALNYEYINQFTECWVPDSEGIINLSGDLGHPENKPNIPVRYLGSLSRFTASADTSANGPLLVILSGPEPGRTAFEELMVEQLSQKKVEAVLVRGLPSGGESLEVPGNITVHNHLPATDLEKEIKQASLVISRSGYSTVMDLATLKKKSVLVPTPGQSEQEYLARYLMHSNFALCIEQEKFKVGSALFLSESFPYSFPELQDQHGLDTAIESLIERLKI